MRQLFARANVDAMHADAQAAEAAMGPEGHASGLRKVLGKWDLTALGVGAIIGAGIFASTGSAIAGGGDHLGAGPAIVISFLMTAVACGFAALCYAEFAAMVPIAGSAYTYAYAALGELVAWIIGWDLVIEYAVGNVAVAVSWSGYFVELLRTFHVYPPAWLITDYRSAVKAAAAVASGTATPAMHEIASALTDAPRVLGVPIIFNLPAIAIVTAITWLLVRGIRESARSNTLMVLLKVFIVLVFLAVGAFYVKPSNYVAYGGFAPNGFKGIGTAAGLIFFAYIGFDAVSTAAEEAKDPKRDMPFGIIASLIICTTLYMLVALVLTGVAPWKEVGTAEPMLTALSLAGSGGFVLTAGRILIGIGAVVAMSSVLLVFQMGQPRIFFSMARDGLLPPWAAKIHPRYKTPHVTTIITGVIVGVFSTFTNIDEAVELTNIGTLFAFVLVAVGVIVLRVREPNRPRPFRVPGSPVTPAIAAVSCIFLMAQLPTVTWIRFFVWLAIGLVLYFAYGYRHSRLRAQLEKAR
jgi:APA family basic amino acid/polyamine antiporter